ncbi:MAG TPA: hypothetical protein VJH69_02410 [Candidatus Paceibacterota bacterium]
MAVRYGIYFFPIVLFLFAAGAHAQTFQASGTGGITIELSPRYPNPGEIVELSAESFSFDLERSNITWFADGKIIGEGPGMKESAVIAGALGSITKISVTAEGQNGTASGSAEIRPTELDLLWESDSYITPFYLGRALPSAGTNLRFQAIPRLRQENGETVPEKDLIYTWRRNNSVVQSVSGRGRSMVTLPSPVLFGTDTITVHAESVDGKLAGESSAIISSVEPKLALYKDHPLFGITYHEALGSQTNIPDSEMTFIAVPYFAQVNSPDDYELLYSWKVNGAEIPTDLNRPNALTISASKSNRLALIELVLTQTNNFIMRSVGKWGIELSGDETGIDPFSEGTQ